MLPLESQPEGSHVMVCVFADPLFEKHRTGYHPECPERVQNTVRYLEAIPWFTKLPRGRIVAAHDQWILRTHSERMLEQTRELCAAGGGHLDPDTFVSPDSFQVALHAAGSAIAAVDRVLSGPDASAFCLIRPPGHHATPTESMGFCIFNNVAIAAHYARDVHHLDRVLIVDFDVHHGNGTQDIFYDDPAVHFLSIHRYPFYPGTGHESETGTGAGLGATRNIPVSFGTSRARYHELFRQGLEASIQQNQPQLIMISAGFDAHKDDPIGSLGLDIEDFEIMTRTVQEAADAHCNGRIVSCLEGGYNLDKLPLLVAAHLKNLR
ncbi:histone deacetylase family protein [Oligoflexus tunisiensis]|uniref:histone deacetylase family protein n=1 Tax=Oligoflexus tunisiensis TaxID=708132 RepID=UPI001C40612F|nr:histone deacetylase [Oligoflexus tunisiensis]